MPTLNWIGKDAVVDHHKQVPFRLLKPIDKLLVGDRVERAIMPVKCISSADAKIGATIAVKVMDMLSEEVRVMKSV